MNKEGLIKIKDKLIDVLSKDKGYFYNVGYELDTDIMPVLEDLSEEKIKCLVRIINYFEIHANPLKKMIAYEEKKDLYDFYSDWAWSHFMTVVMFGMLEVAVKSYPPCVIYKKNGYMHKYKSMEKFLVTFLSESVKNDIARRYKTENNTKLNSFTNVTSHLWEEIRSGFVHEAGIHYKGMEWTNFGGGIGTKEDPIKIETDVPMQELLQITWQAILNSFGYKGQLRLPRYKK